MTTEECKNFIESVCQTEFGQQVRVELTRPDEKFGDFSTNCAMQLAGLLKRSPREIADQLAKRIARDNNFSEVSVAGPGFINIRLKDNILFSGLSSSCDLAQPLKGKSVVAEYSDANAFKALHAGHLYTSLVGDAVANILQEAGGKVHRVNFGGDVGLHVGKAMWAIIEYLGGENPDKLAQIEEGQRAEWVSNRYVEGNEAYNFDSSAKEEIIEANKRVYKIHDSEDHETPFAKIYWQCRQWSYDGFDSLYERLSMHPFDKYYPESAVWQLGLETVQNQTPSVYQKSDGATIFRGEDYGLFTQVFINSEGLPTYAGKDVGLIQAKYRDYKYDLSYIMTDVAQKDHMSVVMKSIEQFEPELVARTVHHTHGRINFADGRKMSSREGNIIMANDVIDSAAEVSESNDPLVVLGAVRYSFLKNRIGSDISYDPQESVALEGNSGPYLQYALVRARSILAKIDSSQAVSNADDLNSSERSLVLKITQFPEVFALASKDFSPHHICNYLYELAQTFNRFYENNRVIDDPRGPLRTHIVISYEKVLSKGLSILGVPTPERM